ncbi:MAG: hypothetical protein AVO35_05055 [Candidatus Aegiribacteria sp. MLS_C]|nr:MAG: hypothetical protein AVO35_05055 [Candidatus Aegiribacteria sp. MLS_C]
MKVRSYREMEHLISSSGAGTVLVAAGPDLYQSGRLQEAAVGRYRSGLGFDVLRRDAGELETGDLKRMLQEGSLFFSGHLLMISQAQKLGKASMEELMESIRKGIQDSAVLLTSGAVPRESSVLRKLESLVPFYICYEPFEKEIPGWISRISSEEGIRLDREASGLLAQYSGRSLQRLADALTRLAIYHGGGSMVNGRGVREVLSGRGGADIFQLGDLVFGGIRNGALDCAARLISQGEEPIAVVGYLHSTWQKVVAAADVLDRGGGKREVTAATGARFPLLDRLIGYADSLRRNSIAEAAEAFARADYELKTGGDVTVVMAGLIFALTSASR